MPPNVHRHAESEPRAEASANEEPMRCMTVYDSLYGQMEFPPVIHVLTDSPIVQRLRDLKQLGNSFYVYPTATHSRFEHSLGVSHLAMKLYRTLVESHREETLNFGVPEMRNMDHEMARKEMQCVGIAGLCHDLGHGPLSHLFEAYVRASPQKGKEGLQKWSHEGASIMLLRHLWKDKQCELGKLGFNDADLRYVELLINGLAPGENWPDNVGRQPWARFTTEIVANKRSGVDVDKIDYIQRDSLRCFGASAFVCTDRLFQGARVLQLENKETTLAFPDKLDGVIEELFLARSRLHRNVYQHRVTKIIDCMILDALNAAGDALEVSDGLDGVMPLRSCVLDPKFYVNTSDWIVLALLHHGFPNAGANGESKTGSIGDTNSATASANRRLGKARAILQRIPNRKLYVTVGTYRDRERAPAAARSQDGNPPPSQADKSKNLVDTLRDNLRQTHEALHTRLTRWEAENGNLPAIHTLQAEITQTAGDMDKTKNPVSATCFFNSRQTGNFTVEHHQSRNSTTTMSTIIVPVSSLTVVSRMELDASEKEVLRGAFEAVAENQKLENAFSYSQTPVSQRICAVETVAQSSALDSSTAKPLSAPLANAAMDGDTADREADVGRKRSREDSADSYGRGAYRAADTSGGISDASIRPPAPILTLNGSPYKVPPGRVKPASHTDDGDEEILM